MPSLEDLDKKIFNSLRYAISETLSVDISGIHGSSFIQADFGADSMSILTIAILLEDDLGVELDPSELPETDYTVSDIAKLLREKFD